MVDPTQYGALRKLLRLPDPTQAGNAVEQSLPSLTRDYTNQESYDAQQSIDKREQAAVDAEDARQKLDQDTQRKAELDGFSSAQVEAAHTRQAVDATTAQTVANTQKLGAEAGATTMEATGKQKLRDMLLGAQSGGGGGTTGGAGKMRPQINADGDVSFAAAPLAKQTPAMIQRSVDALGDAQLKTQNALLEMEKHYPGILDAAKGIDKSSASPGVMGFIGGSGPKYGNASDMAGAAMERLKYKVGMPTPFANLAQETSFGNIEQMAGQLPGVRALSTVLPLLREHQSRWGSETPLATAQRLIHMQNIMGESIKRYQGGDARDFTPVDNTVAGQ